MAKNNPSENNKQIAKNTLALYFRMLFSMLVSLYTSRVVLNTLGVEDYGISNVVSGIVVMLSFLNSAMSSSTQRFLTFELAKKDENKLNQIFCTSVNIHLLVALITFLLSETIGLWFLNTQMVIPTERLDAAHWVYQFSIFSTMITMISVPYNASIIAHEKMNIFAYISILEIVLKLLIVYALVVFDYDKLKLLAVLNFGVVVFIRFIYGQYCGRQFKECHYRLVYEKSLFKEMSHFAGWSLFGNMAFVAFTQGLNILLNLFFGPVVNAARGISVQVQTAVQGFVTNFQMALNPQITKNYATGNLEQMHTLIFASSRYSFFLLYFLSLPILFETDTILTFWLKIFPEHTIGFIRLTLCIMMIDALANPLITAAGATGKIKIYQAVVGGILLLIVPFSYLALKLGGKPEIIYIVHFMMIVIAQIARLMMIRPLIDLSLLRYTREVVMKILLVVTVSFIAPSALYHLLPSHTFNHFLVICMACALSTAISVYYLGLGKAERVFVKQKTMDIKKRLFKK